VNALFAQENRMQFENFVTQVISSSPVGAVVQNLGGGTSLIVLFRVLERLQLCELIMGAGVRGNPFSVKIHP
jgi:hypothetical protein